MLLAGGIGAIGKTVIDGFKARSDSRRDDRRQHVEESSAAADAAKTLTDAASAIVKLQDDQVGEFKKEIRALQSESAALNTRLDNEIQKRMRAEAQVGSITLQIDTLRGQLSEVKARFELTDQERATLKQENAAMKSKLFELSVGVQGLMRQVREAGLDPVYVMDVPAINEKATGPLGPLSS